MPVSKSPPSRPSLIEGHQRLDVGRGAAAAAKARRASVVTIVRAHGVFLRRRVAGRQTNILRWLGVSPAPVGVERPVIVTRVRRRRAA